MYRLNMRLFWLALVPWALAPWPSMAAAMDLTRIDRGISKEPVYQSRPKYCLLVLGPEAKTRVWLVWDGATLYVDRNGNGDLTEPGEKLVAKKTKNQDRDDSRYTFDVGELRDGRRRHLNVSVDVNSLSDYSGLREAIPEAKALLARDPKARVYYVSMDVAMPGHKGIGVDGRILQRAGSSDVNGLLQFADRPQDAPVLHFGGPWTITLYSKPTIRLNRQIDLVLGFGTPGLGKGTFAFVGYEDVVPVNVFPRAEITFPPQKRGVLPVREVYEFKERC